MPHNCDCRLIRRIISVRNVLFQIPKCVQQIDEIVPIISEVAAQITKPTVFDQHQEFA